SRTSAIACALAAALAVIAAAAVLAQAGYLGSVRNAERILARPHISAADARRADSVLVAGVGCSQPEISSDLVSRPPDLKDARGRLKALDKALANPPRPAGGAESELRRLAGTSTYQREQPESPGDLFGGWVQGREAGLQVAACGGFLGLIFRLVEYAAIVAAAVGAAIFAYRRWRHRSRGEAEFEETPELR